MNDIPPVSGDQDATWDYFQNEGIAAFDGSASRLKYLVRQLRGARSVLNIGIGNGYFEEQAQRSGMLVSAIDPSERTVELLRQRLQLGDRVQVAYSQKIPMPESTFDSVVASEVLEHLTDDVLDQTFNEVYRVLKPGGTFLGTVPARERLADQIIVCPCCEKQFHRWGHHQSFTTERMRKLLEPRFHVQSLREMYFAPWNVLNVRGRIVCSIKSLLLKLGVHGSDETIVFSASKPTRLP